MIYILAFCSKFVFKGKKCPLALSESFSRKERTVKKMVINAASAVANVGTVYICRCAYTEGILPFAIAAIIAALAILSLPMYVSKFNEAYRERQQQSNN